MYDLTVENAHCFYAEGMLVSNCQDALQYLALGVTHGYKEHKGRQQTSGGARKTSMAGY